MNNDICQQIENSAHYRELVEKRQRFAFLLSIIMLIIYVGFILLIVFSFKKSNINRRNFARSYWCALLLLVILLAVTVIVGVATGYSEEVITMLQDMLNSLN